MDKARKLLEETPQIASLSEDEQVALLTDGLDEFLDRAVLDATSGADTLLEFGSAVVADVGRTVRQQRPGELLDLLCSPGEDGAPSPFRRPAPTRKAVAQYDVLMLAPKDQYWSAVPQLPFKPTGFAIDADSSVTLRRLFMGNDDMLADVGAPVGMFESKLPLDVICTMISENYGHRGYRSVLGQLLELGSKTPLHRIALGTVEVGALMRMVFGGTGEVRHVIAYGKSISYE